MAVLSWEADFGNDFFEFSEMRGSGVSVSSILDFGF